MLVEKTARELRGKPCLDLEEVAPPKQEICCSRAFGKRLTTIEPTREAVAIYAARACEKLRGQGSLCKKIRVTIRTVMFNPDEPKFARGMICELPYPTDDTRIITKAALAGLDEVFRGDSNSVRPKCCWWIFAREVNSPTICSPRGLAGIRAKFAKTQLSL